MWFDAYNWDNDTHRFPLHQELTQKHIFPNSAPAMWNKLAFETLNADMLHLMNDENHLSERVFVMGCNHSC
jgi:hypothetical protein